MKREPQPRYTAERQGYTAFEVGNQELLQRNSPTILLYDCTNYAEHKHKGGNNNKTSVLLVRFFLLLFFVVFLHLAVHTYNCPKM